MAGFSVEITRSGPDCIMLICGDVDLEHTDNVVSFGLLALGSLSGRAQHLVIDLTGVPFIDAAGLSALVKVRNAASEQGNDVRLRQPQPRVTKVLHLTGLDTAFSIEPTAHPPTPDPVDQRPRQ